MKRYLLTLSIVLAGLYGVPFAAAAPSMAIEVLEQSMESHFPTDAAFSLRARSDAGDIVAASLYVEPGWTAPARLLNPEPFTPGPEVELSATWDTTLETIPPFTAISYHWQLELANGEVFSTPAVQTEYTDGTHDWQRLESDTAIVFWYDQPDEFGQAIFEAAQDGYDHVARITGATTDGAIRVVIYNTQSDFCAFYARGSCQDWIGGVSLTELGCTAQWGSSLNWFIYDVIPHEMAHVFYGGAVFRDTWVGVPTWFNEGIAVYNERHDHSRDQTLVLAAAEREELVPLRLMSARGGSVVEGEVAEWYAQAWSLVDYIADIYGEDVLGELILTMSANVPFEQALAQTTGLDMVQYETDWRAWLGYPVDFIPTPITLPPMVVTPFALPTQPRGQPAATRTPSPVPTATPVEIAMGGEGEEGGEEGGSEEPSGAAPCLSPLGLVLPLAGLAVWRVVRPRR
jgi:hypothetical protein